MDHLIVNIVALCSGSIINNAVHASWARDASSLYTWPDPSNGEVQDDYPCVTDSRV